MRFKYAITSETTMRKPILIHLQPRSNSLLIAAALCCLSMVCLSIDCAAQSSQRAGIPRVGTIKDYPATGLMTGCGNLYFYPTVRTNAAPDAYVFLARGDGSDAWMNLNGRDVRLRQIKSSRGNSAKRGFNYRLGNLRITVVIEDRKPESSAANESDSMFKMKITLMRGQSRRVLRAVGDSDC
jgi:hypothetical protein